MGRFRDRMDDDLRIRGDSAHTRASDLRGVQHFVRHFMRPPDQLPPGATSASTRWTRDRRVSWSYCNQIVGAVRFFDRQVLKTDWAVQQIQYPRTARRLPEILSPQEVAALFRAIPNLNPRALRMTLYAGGLRVAEVPHLRVTAIDGQRMGIRIEQGKGRTDRSVMLSPHLHPVLQAYWRVRRPRPCSSPAPPAGPSHARASLACSTTPAGVPRSPTTSLPLRCATPAPPTCWSTGRISGRSRRCSATGASAPPKPYIPVAATALQATPSPLDRLPDLASLLPPTP